MKSLLRASALALVLVSSAGSMALAQSTPGADTVFLATTLNLSAYGEVRVVPDMASIGMGVVTEAPTAAGALRANAAQMNKVMAALKAAGIAPKDIQTSGLSLNAQYDYVENQPPKLRAYQASNQVTVVIQDLTKLGAAVDATVNAGANQVNGISFGVKSPEAAENAAREAAARALMAKADLYARVTGYKVSRLVSLSESGGYSVPQPMPMMAMARMDKAESTPVASGEMRIRVDVSGVYQLAR